MLPTFARLTSRTRQLAREALQAQAAASPYPIIQKCPSPTCECAETPPNLDIDQNKPLMGTMVAHAEHLLIPSGQADWARKIEDERDTAPWGEFAFHIKQILGPQGECHDPYHNVSVSTCSFEEFSKIRTERSARALLFPSFRMVDGVATDRPGVLDFVKTFLLPLKLHAQHDSLSAEEKRRKTRHAVNASSSTWIGKVKPISAPTIMICSHNTRDSRCGILGPLLHAEFTQYINRRHALRNPGVTQGVYDSANTTRDTAETFVSHPEFRPDVVDHEKDGLHPINVGMLSHVGGHAWAGNVIVYIPPDYCCNPLERVRRGSKPKDEALEPGKMTASQEDPDDEMFEPKKSALAGKSIWYGRVEPKHVEGIVEQTIGHGKIIGELFRGGVNEDGSYLRI